MRNRTLYLECRNGISGDMTVAALLDLGADREGLYRALESLGVPGFTASDRATSRRGMAGRDFDVRLEETHGHGHGHNHGQAHREGHVHRHLSDIAAILARAELSDRARGIARAAFEIVAEAEAKAHGIPIEEVHFHEVGAIDSIVDIVGAAWCLDNLGIERVIVPFLTDGNGTIRCAHGVLPVPVPAVANIVAAHGIPLRIEDVGTEMVTPTGAALVAAIRTDDALPPRFTVARIGIGLGKRDLGRPNFLRAMLIEAAGEAGVDAEDDFLLLESNIDDSTGEQLGMAMERLLDAGALDAHYIPCFMKKSRPGWLLRVVCRTKDAAALEDVVFRCTTTIGIRRYPFSRTELAREAVTVDLPYGTVAVKKCLWRDAVFYYPEFESVRALAERTGRDFAQVFAAAKAGAAKDGVGM